MDREQSGQQVKPISGRMAVWLLLGATLLVAVTLIGGVWYSLYGPDVPPVVSPETTIITEPLRADGWPDYEEWLRQKWSDGITPDENGAIPFWAAMSRHWVSDEVGIDALQKELGGPAEADIVGGLSNPRNLSPSLGSWLSAGTDDSEANKVRAVWDDAEQLDATLELARRQPWRDDEIPPLSDWLDSSEEALALLRRAAAAPRFYPSSPSLLDDQVDALTEIYLPAAQAGREAGRALCRSAMNKLAERRFQFALEDLKAAERLAAYVANGISVVELLVGQAVSRNTDEALLSLAAEKDFSREFLEDVISSRHATLPYRESLRLADEESLGLIISSLAARYTVRTDFDYSVESRGLSFELTPPHGMRVDWRIVIDQSAPLTSLLERAARATTHNSTLQVIDAYEAELAKVAERASLPSAWIDAVSTGERSRLYGRRLASMYSTNARRTYEADRRWRTRRWLVTIALQIVLHERTTGQYPASLDELTTELPPRLTRPDPEAGPPEYRRTETGFTLTDPALDAGQTPDAPTQIVFPPPVEPWPWQDSEMP